MKIVDVLTKDTIVPNLQSKDKKSVIEELVAPISAISGVSATRLTKVLMEREKLGSTGIGDGIAIPHGKLKDLNQMYLGFGRSQKGVEFESLDGKPVYLFFLLITPENSTGLHLKLLARITKMLKNESLKQRLLSSADKETIYSVIQHEDDSF